MDGIIYLVLDLYLSKLKILNKINGEIATDIQ